ncbi:hypothetical protein M427DRAFT_360406 [Gonapodya prolifera JEL478]|uniref:Uncharacterized protein n=1 Tax=Gonapodya prolifera (strain JEL478) TaxID=1344416 RepID=A0A139AB50_GONPJ|nr:hypothetical protein M427DRAFT_360406 [Gonapodya prolifera JEL478]|eukprot:KXS13938.1 hypothetical protein M427DRAFT_360406 [Gonapodya prolifera JEL478]
MAPALTNTPPHFTLVLLTPLLAISTFFHYPISPSTPDPFSSLSAEPDTPNPHQPNFHLPTDSSLPRTFGRLARPFLALFASPAHAPPNPHWVWMLLDQHSTMPCHLPIAIGLRLCITPVDHHPLSSWIAAVLSLFGFKDERIPRQCSRFHDQILQSEWAPGPLHHGFPCSTRDH